MNTKKLTVADWLFQPRYSLCEEVAFSVDVGREKIRRQNHSSKITPVSNASLPNTGKPMT